MDNIGAQIEGILQDPERLQKIMDMAASFGLQNSGETENRSETKSSHEMIRQVSQVIQETESKKQRQEALVQALLPYLNPSRQIKLERAMQISHISRLAGATLRGNLNLSDEKGGLDTHV